MLTQLSTLKARLGILDTDPQYDTVLTNAIQAVSARFDRLCRRTLARTVDLAQEFDPAARNLLALCYPIETVTKFEFKTAETTGWEELTGIDYLIRRACVISLPSTIHYQPSTLVRVTYTGGYVLPGSPPGPGQTALPADLEQAAAEQAAFWFQTRERIGVIRQWPKSDVYEQFADLDLLPHVRSVLSRHQRWG